jgi:HrpA-like RNA helicase
VPQILLDRGLLGDDEVVILQPRRLAARLLARRVAFERGGRLGDEVGYQIRDGVRVVIDSGLAWIARFDPRRGINTLQPVKPRRFWRAK